MQAMAHLAPEEMPGDARALAELLAARLGVITGKLELILVDGRYVDGYRHERLKPSEISGVSIDARDGEASEDHRAPAGLE